MVGLNRLDLTIVVSGVGVLFGGHVVGVDLCHSAEQTDQLKRSSVS